MILCFKYANIANMSFTNKKNDDYYTLSKDTSILSDEPIENDKPDKVPNWFTEFMTTITLFVSIACVIFLSIAIIIAGYYNNQIGSAVEMVAIMWLLLITLVIIIGM